MFNKKAQAAMEFLMTYGWAILVVLVVIGTLAYFGVLNPTGLLPEKCLFQTGIYCKDHLVQSDGNVQFVLSNGLGKKLFISKFTVDFLDVATDDDAPCKLATDDGILNLDASGTKTYSKACGTELPEGKTKLKAIITYTYEDQGTLTHTIEGDILAKVEEAAATP